MDDQPGPASESLHGLIAGYQVTQAIYVAASLSIPDLLASGPRSVDALAATSRTDPRALYRVLRALAAVGVFHEGAGRTFELTPLGEGLRSDGPASLRDWAIYVGRAYHWVAWSDLAESVRTGENAFRRVHGVSTGEYRIAHPEERVIFDRAMTSQSRGAIQGLLESYDFSRFGTAVDVGGGQGALLVALLARYPDMRGVLFDQPHVVADAKQLFDEAGVASRCELVDGSFFEAIPAGGDAYLLKNVLEDWDDGDASAVLRNLRAAVPAGGVLLVMERVIAPPNQGRVGKFSDLNMLVSPGGQNRTLDEFALLLEAEGFTIAEARPTPAGLHIIEAR